MNVNGRKDVDKLWRKNLEVLDVRNFNVALESYGNLQ